MPRCAGDPFRITNQLSEGWRQRAISLPLSPLGEWNSVRDSLAEYGYPIIKAWISNGTIFSRVKNASHVGLCGAAELTDEPEAASELAGMTVSVSLIHFRRKLEDGTGWKPQKGASLRSFFIGQCLLCFPNEYRRWLRECRTGRSRGESSQPLDDLDIVDNRPEPPQVASVRLEVAEILHHAPERVRLALIYTAAGYSQREIAEIIKTTPKGVEMLLRRYRVRYRRGYS